MKKTCSVEEKLLTEGWFEKREEAIPWIMTRKILINNVPASSLSEKIPINSDIRIKEYYKKNYVGKGGIKLEHAIKTFDVCVDGKVALDCGASTGGFTDCLCIFGAKKVYAVDVGHGQLASKLLQSNKVINMEKTNLASPELLQLNPQPQIITLDLSYLSLEKAIYISKDIVSDNGEIIALVKPIFEVQSSEIRRTGEINIRDLHIKVIKHLIKKVYELGLTPINLTYSPVRGNGGAVEYFMHIVKKTSKNEIADDIIESVVETGLSLDRFHK